MVNKTVLFGKKSRVWDGSKGRSKFKLFQKLHNEFMGAVTEQRWSDAKSIGQQCVQIDISDFHVNELEFYNRVIHRVENGLRSLPNT